MGTLRQVKDYTSAVRLPGDFERYDEQGRQKRSRQALFSSSWLGATVNTTLMDLIMIRFPRRGLLQALSQRWIAR